LRKRIKKAFSDKQIAKRIDKLGATIRKDAGKAEVFLLGVLKGTSFFLADLMRAIPGDVTYGFVDVIRDMADTGPDAIETLTSSRSSGDVDLADAKRRIGDRVCLFGGFNEHLLHEADADAVRAEVERCLEAAMEGWLGFSEAVIVRWLRDGSITRDEVHGLLKRVMLDLVEGAPARESALAGIE